METCNVSSFFTSVLNRFSGLIDLFTILELKTKSDGSLSLLLIANLYLAKVKQVSVVLFWFVWQFLRLEDEEERKEEQQQEKKLQLQ